MRHRKAGRRLGRPSDHRKALLRNLCTDLLRYEKLQTTEAKARELQRAVEPLITRARSGTLHDRRMVMRVLYDRDVGAKLFNELAPRFGDRPGGYTRIYKLGQRRGDAAPMAQIELVLEPVEKGRG